MEDYEIEEIRDVANEVDDAEYEVWQDENINDLRRRFIEEGDLESDFKDYCYKEYQMFVND